MAFTRYLKKSTQYKRFQKYMDTKFLKIVTRLDSRNRYFSSNKNINTLELFANLYTINIMEESEFEYYEINNLNNTLNLLYKNGK